MFSTVAASSSWGSHQFAARYRQQCPGACAPLRPNFIQQQQQQQHLSVQPGEAGEGQPAPPPRWKANPLPFLSGLAAAGAPYLPNRPPAADGGDGMVVRLQVDQVRKPPGQQVQQFRKDLEAMLFRQGAQLPNSTTSWAALHTCGKDLAYMDLAVYDTAAAQQAARDAVTKGYVEVDEHRIPARWSTRTAPPLGCTAVTVHQLPVAWCRQGCVEVLLAAAGQAGTVECEFLGGSRTMGDAALSSPAADTVVAWVRTPPEDPLLTSLPTSIAVHGGPAVKVEVTHRPSLAPELWPRLTAELVAARDAIMTVIARHGTQRQGWQQEQTPGPQTLPDSLDDERPPQWQRQRQQQRGQQQPQRGHQGAQRPAGQLRAAPATAGAAAGGPAAGGQDVAAGEPAADTAMAEAGEHAPGEQRPDGVLRHDQDTPMDEAAEDAHAAWLRAQLQHVLQAAHDILDELDREDRPELHWPSLSQQFYAAFSGSLQEEHSPSEREVDAWLRTQLGVPRLSYGSDSEEDAGRDPPTPGAHQQQQEQPQHVQRQQQQQQQGSRRQPARPGRGRQQQRGQQQQQQPSPSPRRSGRANKGTMSESFGAVYGTAMGCGSSGRGGGRGGNSAHPPSPAAATPPRPARGKGKKAS